jgi:hypothetical protein
MALAAVVRDAERDRAGRIGDRAQNLRTRKVKLQSAAKGDEEQGGDQPAAAGDGERRPRDGLDEQAAEAPAKRGGDQLADGAAVVG